jgi:hypothetical protein
MCVCNLGVRIQIGHDLWKLVRECLQSCADVLDLPLMAKDSDTSVETHYARLDCGYLMPPCWSWIQYWIQFSEEDSTEHLEAVLLTAQLKCLLTTFHDLLDSVPYLGYIDRTLIGDLPLCPISQFSIVTMDDQFCITVDHDISVMAGEDNLSAFLGCPKLLRNLLDRRIV